MMKHFLLALTALAALPLFAQTLTVNQKVTTPIKDAAILTVVTGTPTISTSNMTALEAEITFTLPTIDPLYSETVTTADKLVICPNAAGTQLLISNAVAGNAGWFSYTLPTPLSATSPTSLSIRAIAFLDASVLKYDVYVKNGSTYEKAATGITSPSSNATLASVAFEGAGSATNILLAQMPVSSGETPPSPEQVSKYAEWSQDSGKGGALPAGATDPEKQNAFAMNVGGTPHLSVTAIDAQSGTITLKGSYTPATAGGVETTADLDNINGVLTISSYTALGATPTIHKVNVVAQADKTVIIPFPVANAPFVKATLSVTAQTTGADVDAKPKAP
ncbi:MAG: hypothetical protein RR982_03975 [Kiritimatiellia bacterium]